ncbi:ABC transporter permease [Jatrophihabitans fulvus]
MSEQLAGAGAVVTSGDAITAPLRRGRSIGGWPAFLARRLVRLLVSVWVLVTFSFLIVHLIKGDPVRAALGAQASVATVEAKRRELRLDDPLLTQYWHYIGNLLTGRLGESIQLQLPVADVISQRLPNTLVLAGLAFVVAVLLAFPIGIAMAIVTQRGRRRGTELGFTTVAVVLATIPDFVLAVVLVAGLAVATTLLPAAYDGTSASYVIPVVALALGPAAAMARIVRIETLGVLEQDYVRTAWSKRLPPARVYLRHAVPNALTGSLTVTGLVLTGLVAGTVLVESVLAWPGLGPTMVDSIIKKDFPVVQGIVLVYGVLVLLINLLVDLLLAAVDPRSTIRAQA